MNSFHILCIFLFDFSLSLLIRSSAGGLQRVFIAPLLSQSCRSTPIGPVLLMTYLCQWLFLIPALHGRTHAVHFPPSRECRKRQAVSEEPSATDSCCSPDLVRRTTVFSWSADSARLGSARLGVLLCPRALLPASVALQARRLAGPGLR